MKRLGSLLETYGTYEMNGIAFQDRDEIWWLETIGGHSLDREKRVPDDVYVVMPKPAGKLTILIWMTHWAHRRIICVPLTWANLSGITTWTFP